MDFKKFPKIARLDNQTMVITQKIHGTNAQVCIIEDPESSESVKFEGVSYGIICGSRTRFIYPGDDNFGFAAFVHCHKEEFVRKLGPGTHYGEWAGPGINSGEGLSEKTFVLFDHRRYKDELPPQTRTVPVLYAGPIDLTEVSCIMNDLMLNGSKLVPGFMRPEGIVVSIGGTRFKKVFEPEETEWTKGTKTKAPKGPEIDYSHLLQPIRLEKLLSRDERLMLDFPESLPTIVREYFDDLVAEGEISGLPEEIKAIRKGASKQVFKFVKSEVERVRV